MKINSIFAESLKIKEIMKQKMKKIEVTEQEEELILAIRSYVKSFPLGHPQLLIYAQELFDTMTDMPKK